jgi:hypothetical protein
VRSPPDGRAEGVQRIRYETGRCFNPPTNTVADLDGSPASSMSPTRAKSSSKKHPELETSEVGAQAEVDAVTERDLLVVRPRHVEPERILEHVLVPVGRQVGEIHRVAGRDRRASCRAPRWR